MEEPQPDSLCRDRIEPRHEPRGVEPGVGLDVPDYEGGPRGAKRCGVEAHLLRGRVHRLSALLAAEQGLVHRDELDPAASRVDALQGTLDRRERGVRRASPVLHGGGLDGHGDAPAVELLERADRREVLKIVLAAVGTEVPGPDLGCVELEHPDSLASVLPFVVVREEAKHVAAREVGPEPDRAIGAARGQPEREEAQAGQPRLPEGPPAHPTRRLARDAAHRSQSQRTVRLPAPAGTPSERDGAFPSLPAPRGGGAPATPSRRGGADEPAGSVPGGDTRGRALRSRGRVPPPSPRRGAGPPAPRRCRRWRGRRRALGRSARRTRGEPGTRCAERWCRSSPGIAGSTRGRSRAAPGASSRGTSSSRRRP